MTSPLQPLPGSQLPSQVHVILASLTAALLVFAGAILLPIADLGGPVIVSLPASLNTGLGVLYAVTAVLLLCRANPADASFSWIGMAFLFMGALMLAGTFLAPVSDVGWTDAVWQGAAWLWAFGQLGFSLIIGLYAAIGHRRPLRPAFAIAVPIIAVVLVSLLVGLAATALPRLSAPLPYGVLLTLVLLADTAALALLLWLRLRSRTLSHLWLAVAMTAMCINAGLTVAGGEQFSIGWYAGRVCAVITCVAVLQALLLDIGSLFRRIAEANAALDQLVHVDGLTGLANRRRFDEALQTEWRRARREDTVLSLALVQVDGAEDYAQRYGQAEADGLFRQVADVLRDRLRRPADLISRYGADSFAVMMPLTDPVGAVRKAEQVRLSVRALAVPHATTPEDVVTVSVGVATLWPANLRDSEELLMHAADRALYRARLAGQNLVVSEAGPAASPDAEAVLSSAA